MRGALRFGLFALVSACNLFGTTDGPGVNCDTRHAYYADANGDGVGDTGASVYIGCALPDGYTETPPPDADSASVDSGVADSAAQDSGTADSAAQDSGTADSAAQDSGVADSAAQDSASH